MPGPGQNLFNHPTIHQVGGMVTLLPLSKLIQRTVTVKQESHLCWFGCLLYTYIKTGNFFSNQSVRSGQNSFT
jgi:hypothetical protein